MSTFLHSRVYENFIFKSMISAIVLQGFFLLPLKSLAVTDMQLENKYMYKELKSKSRSSTEPNVMAMNEKSNTPEKKKPENQKPETYQKTQKQ